ncbi:MAG: hypothetical protein IPM92_03455 [Saprospiraceae bacterium]|nr:hypothetical protein [Saprospiraceae bacterium]
MKKGLLFTFLISIFGLSSAYCQTQCCCGGLTELPFSGFDFEFTPEPPPAWFINYPSGNSMGPWNISAGSVDHVDKDHYFCSSCGNPNGPSNFIDLFGSPAGPGHGVGTMQYPLTGLTPGADYIIEFYYAKFDKPGNYTANLKIGSWLNVNWTATNPGNIVWLKASYPFTAQSSSANLEFSDTGNNTINGSQIGMLIDDVKIFGCDLVDEEAPTVNNPPDDLQVGCDKDIPKPIDLDISDNCDTSPVIVLKETIEIIDPCNKKVRRNWTITDDCGNSTTATQIIDVIDEFPQIFNPPADVEVGCERDTPKIPSLDIFDNCSNKPTVSFHEKMETIDQCHQKLSRFWTIKDACGNEIVQSQVVDIIDKTPPSFIKKPENKVVYCENDVATEFNNWIINRGNAVASDACGKVVWFTNYGNTPNKYCDSVEVEFIAVDHCGLQNSEFAIFQVKDTTAPTFVVVAQSKNLICEPHVKDSLTAWLQTNGFSAISADCDTIIQYSDFNGDTLQNPLGITFYVKDRCGNLDSSFAVFSYRNSSDTFRITSHSCAWVQNSIDTLKFTNHGCDSIVIHEKLRRSADSVYIKLNTCDLSQIRFDTMKFVNIFACDSFIFREYLYTPPAVSIVQILDCNFLQYARDTLVYQGQFCDSFIITEYIPLRKDQISIVKHTCDSTQADTSMYKFTNSAGCDSTVTIMTLYSQQKVTYLEEKICGLAFEYVDTLKYFVGLCDSLVITHFASLPLDTTKLQNVSCDPSKSGTFFNIFSNQFGCDSLVISDIEFIPPDSTIIFQSTCLLSQAGIRYDILMNHLGCDSIIQTITSFISSDTTYILQSTCDYAATGKDTLVFLGTFCDSIVFVETNFIPADTIRIRQVSCEPTDTGRTQVLLKNIKGCDSLVQIQTNFEPLVLNYKLDSISCFNQKDGAFSILNIKDLNQPIELVLNHQRFGNLNRISNLGPGNYELYVRDQKDCITDTLRFVLLNPEELIVDLGPNRNVKAGTQIILNLQSNKVLSQIIWSPSKFSQCDTCKQIELKAEQDFWIYAQAIDDRNCAQTDSIFIRVQKSTTVFAPNVFHLMVTRSMIIFSSKEKMDTS